MSLSDRIALVDKGTLKQIGMPEELYSKPENLFIASFSGSPRINMFEVGIEKEFFVYGSLRWRIPEDYLSKVKNMTKVIIGIRPENVRVCLKPERDSFPVKLSAVEKIGKDSILNLNWQNKILKAIVDKELVNKIGNGYDLWIKFDNKNLCLFDTDSNLSLL